MILVTGATGLVGAHLLCQLVKNGENVRALYREKASIELVKKVFLLREVNLVLLEKVQWHQADITDIPALAPAFEGIEKVYHCAAFISFSNSHFSILKKVNIEGTANMVNLSLMHGVKKFCHVSSVATLGNPKNGKQIDEDCHWNPDDDNNVYAITKYGAEMEVWRAAQEGLPVVVVNPSVIIGPSFFESGSGVIFKLIENGLSYYPSGGVGIIHIDKVVDYIIKLMDTPIAGERFILSDENMLYKDLLESVALQTSKKPPTKKVGKTALAFLWRLDAFITFITGKKRWLNREMARTLVSHNYYSNAKIKAFLEGLS